MMKETEDFRFDEAQDDRIWIHDKVAGYGKWFTNSELRELFSIQSNKKEQPMKCPYCGHD